MRKLMIAGLAIVVIAGLCYGAVRVNLDLAGQVADNTMWKVTGQEFTISLPADDSFRAIGIPFMDSGVTMLYLRSTTLDATDLPYQFSLCLGSKVSANHCSCETVDLRCDKFLITDVLRDHRDGNAFLDSDSILIRNPNAAVIKVSVFAAGIDK